MNTIRKLAWEQFYVSVGFSSRLITGETIDDATSTVTATDKDGHDATSTLIDTGTTEVEGAYLKARITGGTTTDDPYIITFKAITSLDNQYQYDVRLRIYERM